MIFVFQDFIVSGPVPCLNNCGRFYRDPYRNGNLTKHLKYECGVPKQFNCSYYFKLFARKRDLNRHCGLVHKLILKN